MSEYSMTELRDMAPAYVLGALNADEVAAFERALVTSTELAQEVQAYRAVVTRIAQVGDVSPPADVRSRFLDRIASQKSATMPPAAPVQPAAPASATPTTDRPAFTLSTGNANAPRPASEKAPQGNWWLTGMLGVGLAASLLFAVQRNSQVTSLSASLAQRDSIIASRALLLAQRDSALNTVLEAERNLIMVNLVSPNDGPGMQFFYDVKKGRGMIHAFRLKPAAPGRAYQLWLIKDGKPVPSRVFNAGTDEHGLVWGIELPTDLKGITAVAITEEPAGGSPQPTTTPFMVGELPKAPQ